MKKLNLNEDFICRIWENDSYYTEMKTTDGKKVVVLDRGKKNHDAGPDYKNARIIIDGVIFSGSIEIHRSMKDWKLHSHKGDNKYNDLILQVVFYGSDLENESDTPVVKKSRPIPTVVLSEHLTSSIHEIWKDIINNPSPTFKLPCYPDNKNVAHSLKVNWLNELSLERLEYKTGRIKGRLEDFSPNENKRVTWEQILFEFVCEALGFSKNKEQFLRLSKNVDLKTIKNSVLSKTGLDSLLYGLSGFLNDLRFKDPYIEELKLSWNRLRTVYKKEIIDKSEWNFFRLRPPNFPTLRIAYASGLLYELMYNDFFKNVIHIFEESDKVMKDLSKLFKNVQVSDYWKKHYNFGKYSKSVTGLLGNERITDIITNVILPVVCLYSVSFNDLKLKNRVEFFYRKEKRNNLVNEVTKVMKKQLDIRVNNLADEQALIHLHNFYCIKGNCNECKIGRSVFANERVNEPLKIILY